MTAEQVAEQILAAIGRPDFAVQLEALRGELSLDVILLLHRRANSYNLRNARRSLHIAEAAGDVAALLGTPEAYALVDWAKGNALFHHSEYATALAAYQRSEAVYRQLDRPFMVTKLQINQLAALRGTGGHRAAIALAEQARATSLAADEPDQSVLALLDMNLGAIHRQLGEFDTALNVLNRGRAIFAALNDKTEVARIDINRANVLQELGRFMEADTLLHTSRVILHDGGYDQEAARADYNLGTLAYRRGQYQLALQHFEQARAEFIAVDNEGDVAMVDLFRSLVYRELNMLIETITLASDAERTMQRDAAGWLRALAQINQGIAYRRLGAHSAAEQHLLRARRNFRRQGASNRVLTLDLERASLALELGKPTRAKRIAAHVARALEQQAWPEIKIELELLLARCDLEHEPPRAMLAHRRAQHALTLAESHNMPSRMAALWLLGRSYVALGDLQNAWQALSAAMDAIEQIRALLPIDEFSTGFMEDKLPVYADAVHLSRRTGDPARTLFVLDRATAAPLPGFLKTRDMNFQADPAAESRLLELREAWHWQQSWIETAEIVKGQDSTPNDDIRRKLRTLEAEIAELTRRIQVQAQQPDQERSSYNGTADETAFLAALQARLLPREALIQYFEDDGKIGALLLTDSTVQLLPELTPVAVLQRLLGAWRLMIATRQLAEAATSHASAYPHLRRMYDLLVQPLTEWLKQKDRLYVVLPPGFHDLPFAAFYDGNAHLIERFVITHLSAARALLGNHTHANTQLSGRASALIIGYSDGGRLPLAIAEAEAVQSALEPSMRTICLTEAAATGKHFRAIVQNQQLLHLATHAVFRSDNPMFSWIRLADTRLTVADLYELTLPRRPLVVLSACETGRGQPRGGGLLGMGRSFLAAGASGLVVSLWPVADPDAASLMVDFYHGLSIGRGTPNALALADAQRTAIERMAPVSAWAAFLYLAA